MYFIMEHKEICQLGMYYLNVTNSSSCCVKIFRTLFKDIYETSFYRFMHVDTEINYSCLDKS